MQWYKSVAPSTDTEIIESIAAKKKWRPPSMIPSLPAATPQKKQSVAENATERNASVSQGGSGLTHATGHRPVSSTFGIMAYHDDILVMSRYRITRAGQVVDL